MKDLGHGHVYPRPDGARARCGGPALCSRCRADAESQADQVAQVAQVDQVDQVGQVDQGARLSIEHADVDRVDDPPAELATGVYVSIMVPDGMTYSGSLHGTGPLGAHELAQMVRSAAAAAGAGHSPELGQLLQ